MTLIERLRSGMATVALYALLALFTFPTFGQMIAGEHGLAYVHDVFELPRTGIFDAWPTYGPTLWNPYLTAGNALLAQQSIPPYALDVAIGLLWGPFAGYALSGWLYAALAGLSMHLFLRDSLGLATVAVLGGSVIYMFGFATFIYGAALSAMPLSLWLMDRSLVRSPRRWRYVLAGALAGGALLYHGLSQIVLIAAVAQLAYALVVAPPGTRRPRVGVWLTTWTLALGLYAPVLLTQLVMLPISQRTIWELRALFDSRPLEAIRDTLGHYSATLIGVPMNADIGQSPAHFGTYFLGAIGLPLLVVGAIWGRHTPRTRFLLLLLAAIPTIDLIGLLLTPVQDELGFLKSFQVVRVRHLFPFALAATVALGIDAVAGWWLGERQGWRRDRFRWLLLATTAAPVAITTIVAAGQVLRRRRDVLALESTALGWALVLLALLVGAAVVVATIVVMWRGRRDRARPRVGPVFLLALLLLAGERALYAHGERLVGRDIGDWASHLGMTPAQAFLLRQPGIHHERVMTFGEDANRMGAVSLLQADGYQAIYPLSYHAFFGGLIDPQLDADPAMATYYRKWGNGAITFGPAVDPELVALAGVRWLYVRGNETPAVPGIRPRFRDGDVTLYEVSSVLPRAFLAREVRVLRDTAEVIAELAAADLATLRSTAFVVDGPSADALAPMPVKDEKATGTASIVATSPDTAEIAVDSPGPAILVLTDVMAPGWIAERDGTRVSIATVDGTFRGVAVDQSTVRVVFRYEPLFTYFGFVAAGLALLVALGWAALARRSDRRLDR